MHDKEEGCFNCKFFEDIPGEYNCLKLPWADMSPKGWCTQYKNEEDD